MFKRTISLICAALCAVSLCACGGSSKQVSMYDLQKSMLEADTSLPEMKVTGSWEDDANKAFAYISDLDYSKVSGYFLAYAADGMAYEIAVVQLKDKADASAAADSLKSHVQDRVQIYKTYEPKQTERAENAVVKTDGSFVLLIMCDDQQKVEAAFKNFVK